MKTTRVDGRERRAEGSGQGIGKVVRALVALLFLVPGMAAQTVSWHVSMSGDDGADGSAQYPFRTIQHAMDVAGSGDTIKVAAGTYAESLSPLRKLIFRGGYDASFLEASRDYFAYRSVVQPSSGPIFYDEHSCTIDGFVLDGSSGASVGVDIYAGHSVVSHNVIQNLHQSGAYGIVTRYLGTGSVTALSNTVVQNHLIGGGSAIVGISVQDNTDGLALVKNNIVYDNDTGISQNASGVAVDYNCVYGSKYSNYSGNYPNAGPHDIQLNPVLRDTAQQDYRIRETSPCLDTGDPGDDPGAEPSPYNARIDMGAYGGSANSPYIPPVPPPPALLSPSDNGTHVSVNPTLVWQTSQDASSYRVQVAYDAAFTAIVADTSVADTSVVLSSLASSTMYYWHVSTSVTLGTSAYSSAFQFTTGGGVLHVSTLGNDSNDGSAAHPLRNIQTALTGANAGDTIKVAAGTFSQQLATQTQVVIQGGYDEMFTEAARDIFTNRSVLEGVATTMLVDNNASTIDGLFFFGNSGVTDAAIKVYDGSVVRHTVVRNASSGGTGIKVYGGAEVINNTVYACTYGIWIQSGTGTPSIRNNTVASGSWGMYTSAYSSAVRQYNNVYGNSFNYSGTYSDPGIGDIGLSPQFRVPADSDFRINELSPCRDAGDPSDLPGDELAPYDSRIDIGAYGGTIHSPFLPPVPGAPVLALPADGAVHQSLDPLLGWNKIPDVSFYQLQVSTEPGFSTGILFDNAALTDTLYALSGLDRDATYYWRVRAMATMGTGPYADASSFTTTDGVLCVSVAGSDANAGTVTAPLRYIPTALNRAVSGDTIKIAGGTYNGGVTTQCQVVIRGGYAETFTEVDRNVFVHRTTLLGISATMLKDEKASTIEGLHFSGSSSVNDAAIKVYDGSIVRQNVVRGATSGGTGIEIYGGATVVNNTVYSCTYGIWLNLGTGTPNVRNNILSGNSWGMFTNAYTYAERPYNDVFGGSFPYYGSDENPGIGDISLNPQFRDVTNNDFRLLATSPCVDAGDPDAQYNDPDGSRNDMGAFFYDAPPAAPELLLADPGVHAITLTWRRSSEPDLRGYRVYGGTSPDPSTVVDSTGSPEDTSRTIASLLFGSTYHFRITALDFSLIESVPSNELSAMPEGTPLEADSVALVDLYNNTNGPNWTTRTNWLAGPLDSWFGVTLSNGRVWRIDLSSNNNVTGQLPEALTSLTELEVLVINDGGLTGPLPAWLGSMPMLNDIRLMGHQFTGPIPTEWSNLTDLIALQLSGNQLTGSIPAWLGSLDSLWCLWLGQNQFTGIIPSELGGLQGLYYLDLANNDLTGSVPPEIGNAGELRDLELHGNQLTGTIPQELGRLSNLENLNLQLNQLTGAIPDSLTRLNSLKYLQLSSNRFTSLPNLTGLDSLLSLLVPYNSMTFRSLEPNVGAASDGYEYHSQDSVGLEHDTTVAWRSMLALSAPIDGDNTQYQWMFNGEDIGSLGRELTIGSVESTNVGTYSWRSTNTLLPELTLYGRPIHVSVVQTQVQKDSLALVALYNSTGGPTWTNATNWLIGPVDSWFGVEVSEGRVARLTLRTNNLTGSLPAELANLDSLSHLDIGENPSLTGFPAELGGMKNLRHLDVATTGLTGAVFPAIMQLTALEYLGLNNTTWDAPLPHEIGNLVDLKELHLDSGSLTGEIPAELWSLTDLEVVRFVNTGITGVLPEEISNLTKLRDLTIEGHQLTGTIPISIGNLDSLHQLSLAGNGLTGPVPDELGSLRSLETLRLCSNQLTGTIPLWVGSLTQLRQLDIGSNQFTGTVPDTLRNLVLLQALHLDNLPLDPGPIPSWVTSLPDLDIISMENASRTGQIPADIGNLSGLRVVNVSWNDLEGSIPSSVGSLAQLEFFNVGTNRLSGTVPAAFASLPTFTSLDIGDNEFDILPDLTGSTTLTHLNAAGNRFTFEDIEPNLALGPAVFTYAPQDSFGVRSDTLLYEGDTFTCTISVGGSANAYQWMRNGSDLPGATDASLTVPSIRSKDAGYYVCRVTSTVVTDLTLYSTPFVLTVFDTLAPSKPQNLAVVPGDGSAMLTWSRNPDDDVYAYRIVYQRSIQPAMIDSTYGDNPDTSIVIQNLIQGTTYTFRIAAADFAGNESEWSEPAHVTLPYGPLAGEYAVDDSTLLLLHMNDQDGTRVLDLSGGAWDGIAEGTTIVDGRFGKARMFDGIDDTVWTAYDGNFGTGPFTVEFWVYVNAWSSSGHQYLIGNRGENDGTTWWIGVYDEGRINVDGGSGQVTSSPGEVDLGQWYHLAVIRDEASQLSIYKNGVLVRMLTQSGDFTGGTRTGIGALPGGSENEALNGIIDEVRISGVVRGSQDFKLQLPPTNLSIPSVTATSVSLAWSNGGGGVPLKRYYVYRGPDSTSVTLIDSSDGTTYVDTGVVSDAWYYYMVSAVDETGFEGIKSFAAVARTLPEEPIGPTNLTASLITASRIDLAWQDNSANEDLFRVFRRVGSDVDSSATVGAQVAAYQDLDLPDSTTFYYRVRAENAGGVSSFSNEFQISTPTAPHAPGSVVLQVVSSTQIDVTWVDSSDNEQGFVVQRREGVAPIGTGFEVVASLPANATFCQNTGLNPAATYYFRVGAYNEIDTSLTYAGSVTTYEPPDVLPPMRPLDAYVTPDRWTNDSVYAIHWTPGLDPSNIYFLRYRFGAAPTQSEPGTRVPADDSSAVVSVTEQGELSVYITLEDGAGNWHSDSAVVLIVKHDSEPPGAPISMDISPTGWSHTGQFTATWTNPWDVSGIAAVYYTVNVSPSVGNPGTRTAVTGTSLPFTVSTPGQNTVYLYLEDLAGNRDVRTAVPVIVRFDNRGPVIDHDSLGVASFSTGSPQSIAIDATSTDAHSGVMALTLQYRRYAAPWGSAGTAQYPSAAGGTISIPHTFLSANARNGVDYRIVAADSASNVSSSPVHSVRITIPVPVLRTDPEGNLVTQPNVSSLPAGTPDVYAYRLFSVPLDLNEKAPAEIFENQTGLGQYDRTAWRFFSYNSSLPASNPFDEYPAIRNSPIITPGKAFFLILREGIVVKAGPGAIVKAEDLNKTGLVLQEGFNFVGNPLNIDIPLDSLSLSNGLPLSGRTWMFVGAGGTNSGWSPNPATLKAWEGIVIKLLAGEATTLTFNIADRSSVAAPEQLPARMLADKRLKEERWTLRMTATRTDNGVSDAENIAGVSPEAIDGYGSEDLTEPPFMGAGMVSVSFTGDAGALTHDVRASGKEGYVWDLVLLTAEHRVPVDLWIDGTDKPDKRVFLFDLDTRMAYDAEASPQVRVNSGDGEKHCRLVVGSMAYIEDNSDGIDAVPRSVVLHQNYPNPFNPETVIRFTLPGTSPVRLTVYDMVGRRIRTLINTSMDAGYHEEYFNAAGLSAGIYILRLEAGTTMTARKIVLLK